MSFLFFAFRDVAFNFSEAKVSTAEVKPVSEVEGGQMLPDPERKVRVSPWIQLRHRRGRQRMSRARLMESSPQSKM